MQNGVPDCYFSGSAGDLWVEVKYVKAPKRNTTLFGANLSDLQLKWLNDRYKEGRNVGVILGTNIGSCIMVNGWWNKLINREMLTNTKQDLVEWIIKQTLG
jgi:hypothetical protein